jgi:hypothetical protein
MLVDCELDFHPNDLNGHGKYTHKVTIEDCELVEGRGKDFVVDVDDIDTDTIRLDICAKWPDCLEDPASFILFGDPDVLPKSASSRHFGELELYYDEQDLFNLVCQTPIRTVAVVAQLVEGATAVARNKKTLDVGGAFIRGKDKVVCRFKK